MKTNLVHNQFSPCLQNAYRLSITIGNKDWGKFIGSEKYIV